MPECCKNQKSGRFCSECGSPLENGPLWDLLKSVRASEKSLRTYAKKLRNGEYAPANAEPSFRLSRGDKAELQAEAWKARGDALVELLKRASLESTETP